MVGDRVGRLRIALFTVDVPTLLHRELRRLRGLGAEGFVIDLRGCPGGDPVAALRLADGFVARGTPLAERRDPDGDVIAIAARQGDPDLSPLAILVDRSTASAAEVFAGGLQHARRAVVVGETTYGKGVATIAVPLPGGGVDLAPAATYGLPGGGSIQGVGVDPDLRVARAAGSSDGDGALRAAVAVVRARLERPSGRPSAHEAAGELAELGERVR